MFTASKAMTGENSASFFSPDAALAGRENGRLRRQALTLVSSGRSPRARSYDTIDVEPDAETGSCWCFMRPSGRPCFSPAMLSDLAAMQTSLRQLAAARPDATAAFRFFVMASRLSGVFSLGGDLALFVDAIEARERARLQEYAYACIDTLYANSRAYDAPLVTVALVQGDALGGGFECALSFDFIIAERQARMGLPEVLFNLFPGMGAYSFLSRRLDPIRAQQMILSGRIYTAEELHSMGIVDVLAEDGQGEAAARSFIAKHTRTFNACQAILGARRRVHPVSHGELRDVVDIWVEAALNLGQSDLRKMKHLAAAQGRKRR